MYVNIITTHCAPLPHKVLVAQWIESLISNQESLVQFPNNYVLGFIQGSSFFLHPHCTCYQSFPTHLCYISAQY